MGAPVLLFLSRIDRKKGLDLLLAAFAHVREKHAEATLVVAGDGDPAFIATLKRQSQRLGLDASILWAGFLQGPDKLAALADADIFVLPSYSENFGVAVVESMAAGLPVIVSDQVGIHREIATAEAGLVVPCSAEALALALETMIADPSLRAAMGAKAMELSRKFSTEIIARQLSEIYERVANKRNRSAAA
jgi:glycosyltransferase involved in cell wall biosynthesis